LYAIVFSYFFDRRSLVRTGAIDAVMSQTTIVMRKFFAPTSDMKSRAKRQPHKAGRSDRTGLKMISDCDYSSGTFQPCVVFNLSGGRL